MKLKTRNAGGLKASNISSKSESLCVPAAQSPLLDEYRRDEGDSLGRGERSEIIVGDRVLIVVQLDDANGRSIIFSGDKEMICLERGFFIPRERSRTPALQS